jgi:hypothetical protein
MNKYYTIESAVPLLGHLDKITLKKYIGLHQLSHDAELIERRGGYKKLYDLDKLRNMLAIHEQDVIRRGHRRGFVPEGFEYTNLCHE